MKGCLKCSHARRGCVMLLFAVLVIGHVYAVATSSECWPFSPYPMYSELQTGQSLQVVRMVGVKSDGSEFALNGTWLRNRLTTWNEWGPKGQEKIRHAVREYLLYYRHAKAAGKIKGPALHAIRVYQCTWHVKSKSTREPDNKQLLTIVSVHKAPATKQQPKAIVYAAS